MPQRERGADVTQGRPKGISFSSLLWAFEHPVGVLGLLGLCINVRSTDANHAVSPASPKSLYQDILKEALDGWALLLLGARFWLHRATGMDYWFITNC